MKAKSIIFLYFIILFIGCSKSDYNINQIKELYKEYNPGKEFVNFRQVVIINENAGCIGCNQRFASEMEAKINDDNTLFIISGNGSKVDFSFYFDMVQDNVILDKANKMRRTDFKKKSMIIDLDPNNRIEKVTIIDINRYSMQ